MKYFLQVLVVLGILGLAGQSFAEQSCPVCNAAAADEYGKKAVGQLGRGVANVGLSWVELGNQPIQEVKTNGPSGILIGVVKGVGHTCLRILEGAGEIITCPMPRAKDGKYTQIADDCPLGVLGATDR